MNSFRLELKIALCEWISILSVLVCNVGIKCAIVYVEQKVLL